MGRNNTILQGLKEYINVRVPENIASFERVVRIFAKFAGISSLSNLPCVGVTSSPAWTPGLPVPQVGYLLVYDTAGFSPCEKIDTDEQRRGTPRRVHVRAVQDTQTQQHDARVLARGASTAALHQGSRQRADGRTYPRGHDRARSAWCGIYLIK